MIANDRAQISQAHVQDGLCLCCLLLWNILRVLKHFVDVHNYFVFVFVRFLLYVVYVFALCSPYLEDNKVSIYLSFYATSFIYLPSTLLFIYRPPISIFTLHNHLCRPRLLSNNTLHFYIIEPRHKISNNVACATSKDSDQPAHTRSLIRAFASRLNILWLLSYWPNIIWIF